MKFDFDDILLTPELSNITSRSQVIPYDINDMLPLMTAPMDTVIDINNANTFIENKIYSVMPRGERETDISCNRSYWYSYGLDEFQDIFLNSKLDFYDVDCNKFYALIDVANGHMQLIIDLIKRAKSMYGEQIVLMVGNIASPRAFQYLGEAGADYIRCGIGGGQACLTTVNTGVGYPMASLISECFSLKENMVNKPKIVADGGFKKYSDIIKALALGADYVMLGSILNKSLESCAPTKLQVGNNIIESDIPDLKIDRMIKEGKLVKEFRGMSTKAVQSKWGKSEIKTAEGITTYNKVEYKLATWVENFESYLRSAMSYTNSFSLDEFKGSNFELITQASFNRFNK